MEEPDKAALARADDTANPDEQPKPEANQATSVKAGAGNQNNAETRANQEGNDVNQVPIPPNDKTQTPHAERPHPSVISEFDPFASPSQAAGQKTPTSALWSSQLGIPFHASFTNDGDESRNTQTPPMEKPGNSVAQAPRKNAQKNHQGPSLSTSDTYSDSPSAARQKQSRGDASQTAEQQHRHASAMITEGESISNPKPKELAFDFQGFLAQLRTRQAESIQKYLKRCVGFRPKFELVFILRPFQLPGQLCETLLYGQRANQAHSRFSGCEDLPVSDLFRILADFLIRSLSP